MLEEINFTLTLIIPELSRKEQMKMKYFDKIIINSILIIVLLLGAVMSTSANMTAPLPNIHEHPSSALYKANSNLIVQKENLIIVCNYAWCDVTALYYIEAQKTEQEFAFEFILPDKVEVSVRIGTKEVSVQTVSSDPMDDREKNALLLSPTTWSHITPNTSAETYPKRQDM